MEDLNKPINKIVSIDEYLEHCTTGLQNIHSFQAYTEHLQKLTLY